MREGIRCARQADCDGIAHDRIEITQCWRCRTRYSIQPRAPGNVNRADI